jgi:hypothetical protein
VFPNHAVFTSDPSQHQILEDLREEVHKYFFIQIKASQLRHGRRLMDDTELNKELREGDWDPGIFLRAMDKAFRGRRQPIPGSSMGLESQ